MTAIPTMPRHLELEGELRASHQWRAYHVFYGGNPLVVLTECLIPLAEELVAEGLVVEYFYINYWLEGSHVRLRVRVSPKNSADVDRRILGGVREYLAQSPSYHPMAELADNNFYEKLFVGEFTDADRPMYFHEDGTPRFAENNSVEIRPYEPEWLRYGGEQGMLISEHFFVESTRMAVRAMELGNLGVRTILLGISTQLTFITALCMLRDLERVADFFVAYHRRWAAGYDANPAYGTEEGRREHAATARGIRRRVLCAAQGILDGNTADLPDFLRDWVQVCTRTRMLVEQAHAQSPLLFSYDSGVAPARSVEDAAWSLCHSFIHMTNNRLMVSVADEAFLAYQLASALDQELGHDH